MKARNNLIDIFRLICSILVVAIHTHPLKDINLYLGFFATDVLPRVAVPFFFAISGYYYIRMLNNGNQNFKKYIITILKSYAFWSIIYSLLQLYIYLKNDLSLIGYMYDTIIAFFITGSYYHLWYLLALMISVCIVTAAYKCKLLKQLFVFSLIIFFIGCLGCSYYSFGLKIPVVSSLINLNSFDLIRKYFCMGLPFFLSGYFIQSIELKLEKLSNRQLISSICICFFLFLSEIYIVMKMKLAANIVLTLFLYPLVISIILFLLKNPLPNARKTGLLSKKLSEYIYFVHPLFIFVFSNVVNDYIHINTYSTMSFVLVLCLSFIFGLSVIKLKSIHLKLKH